jgi:hypothetical protein
MKKLRDEIEFKSEGGLFDLIDNHVKGAYNITDEEYDYITTNITDEELSDFCDAIGLGSDNANVSFSSIRKGLEIRNKYLIEFYKL